MAKSGKGKTGKATPQKAVAKPQKVVQKVVQTPQKAVQQKPQHTNNMPEEKTKQEEIKKPQPIPEATYEEVHLTEEEFGEKYKRADSSDCAEGVEVFTKERFGDKWFAKPVLKIGVATVDTAAFNDLVLRGTAYIKK